MAVTSTNLIQGPASLWAATFGTAEPAVGAAPAAGWTDLGGTNGGVTLTITDSYAVLTVDQIIHEIERRRTGRVVTVATSLAEATLENLARAINNTAPVGKVLEGDDGDAAFKPAYSAILMRGLGPNGVARDFILRKTLATEAVGLPYTKDGQTLVPVTWTAHWVSASIKPFRIADV